MIVCFGEALVDLYALPLGRDVETAEGFAPRVGGAPANVAIALGRMGLRTRFVGAVGRDGHGQRLVDALVAAGVEVSCVQRRAERTGITFVRVEADGARSFLFYRGGGADYALELEALRADDPLREARWIVLGSSAFVAEPLASAARWIFAEALARGVAVVADLNVRSHLWRDPSALRAAVDALCAAATVLKASDDDLRGLGLEVNLEALASRCRAGALTVLTSGAAGWQAARGAQRWHAEAGAVTAVDATGAGDAFVAGLLAGLVDPAGLAHGSRVEGALRAAGALGARAVTALGAVEALVPPWPKPVQDTLSKPEVTR